MDLRQYAKQLKSHTPQGAPGYCHEAILRKALRHLPCCIVAYKQTYAFVINVAFV
jgi:hypothetical protein